MVKDIVIIANFCRDFSETDNGRFMYLCKELSKDHQVEIITSDFKHTEKVYKTQLTHNWPFKITFLHEPGYKRNISPQRFLSHRKWGLEVEKYLKKRKVPDVIYCAVPSLTAPLKAAEYCRKKGIKFIIDIQDLWPEAFEMVVRVPVLNKILFSPFRMLADLIYCQADEICGVSNTYVERALRVNRKVRKGHAVFLGTSLKTFDDNAEQNKVIKEDPEELWIGYCGSLNKSYDLTVVFDALTILKRSGAKPPKFIVMGAGEKASEFEAYSEKLGVNVQFTGKLPYNQMCGRLKVCDIAVNPITHKASQSIINKHGDYAAAGIPVINTQESPEYRTLVNRYQMGFNCKNGDAKDLAEKIRKLCTDEALRQKMGEGARRCAEEKFDRRNSYKELIDAILR